jgi:predicted PurR-regulated permease PerM
LDDKKAKAKWIIGIVSICIIIYMALQQIDRVLGFGRWLFQLILPLLMGGAVAFVINVPLRPLERHFFPNSSRPWVYKIRRPCCIFLAILIILGIFAGVGGLVIPELISAFSILGHSISSAAKSLQELNLLVYGEDSAILQIVNSLDINWSEIQATLINFIKNSAVGVVDSTVSVVGSIVSSVVNFAIALVFGIYILSAKEKLKAQAVVILRAWMPERFTEKFLHIAGVVNLSFRKYVVGQTTEAVILGSLCAIGMMILRLPYAPMIGALVGVTALIPIVGAFIGAAVGAFMILVVNPVQAVIFIGFLLALQQIEGNIIYPRVVGSSMGLPAIWVLAAVTIGGSLGGIGGMLLSVPTAAALYTLVGEATQKRAKIKGVSLSIPTEPVCSVPQKPVKKKSKPQSSHRN